MMKSIFKTIAVAAMALFVVSVSAQEKQLTPYERSAKSGIDQISKYVELNPEQIAKLTAKFTENAKARAEATTPEAKDATWKKQWYDTKEVLTPEQFKTYMDGRKADEAAKKAAEK